MHVISGQTRPVAFLKATDLPSAPLTYGASVSKTLMPTGYGGTAGVGLVLTPVLQGPCLRHR